jgi:hypothetical protein
MMILCALYTTLEYIENIRLLTSINLIYKFNPKILLLIISYLLIKCLKKNIYFQKDINFHLLIKKNKFKRFKKRTYN